MEVVHTVVFAAAPGGGNPCPVVLNADGLTGEEMQRMTQEFRQESAFITQAEAPDCDYKLRYFVPDHELEMCVHATIACATVLADRGLLDRPSVVFQTKIGKVPVDWERTDSEILVAVNQFLPEFSKRQIPAYEVCRALGIAEEELLPYPLESVSTSRYKLMVPLRSRDVLDRLEPDFEKMWNLCDEFQVSGFYPFAVESNVFYARQFPNRAGYPEDPATGVAASALSAYLIRHEVLPVKPGWNRYTIRQGYAMGRPSLIYADAFCEGGKIQKTRVCGTAEICAEQAESLVKN